MYPLPTAGEVAPLSVKRMCFIEMRTGSQQRGVEAITMVGGDDDDLSLKLHDAVQQVQEAVQRGSRRTVRPEARLSDPANQGRNCQVVKLWSRDEATVPDPPAPPPRDSQNLIQCPSSPP